MTRAALAILTLMACGPRSEPTPPAADPAAPGPVRSAGSRAAVAPEPHPPAGGERAVEGGEAPPPEARRFRHLLVGALMRAPMRLTWTAWTQDAHARLRLTCQEGGHARIEGLGRPGQIGVALTGKENDERYWFPPVVVDYRETGGTHDFTAVSPPRSLRGCRGLPTRVRLTCAPDRVAVLAAGAALIPGTKPDDPGHRAPTWRPSGRATVDAERCEATLPDTAPGSSFLADTIAAQPVVWVVDRPIEWAFENSDVVVQAGGYRFLPTP